MIVSPTNMQQWNQMATFLFAFGHVQPSPDLKLLGWVSGGKLVIVVGLHAFMGSVAQIHVAFAPGWHFPPRRLLREVFRYAFEDTRRAMLLGVVNSNNDAAMKFDTRLGFTEITRLPGMHDDGGDLVLLGMRRDECKYLLPEVKRAA